MLTHLYEIASRGCTGSTIHGRVIAGIPVSFTPGPLAIAFGAPMKPEQDEPAEGFTERLQVVCYQLTRSAEASIAQEWQQAK